MSAKFYRARAPRATLFYVTGRAALPRCPMILHAHPARDEIKSIVSCDTTSQPTPLPRSLTHRFSEVPAATPVPNRFIGLLTASLAAQPEIDFPPEEWLGLIRPTIL